MVVVVALSHRSPGRGEPTLAAQFLLLQLLVIGVLLVIVALLSVRQSTAEFTTRQGAQMRSVAEYVANRSVVRQQLTRARDSSVAANDTPRVLAPAVDRGLSLSGATDVMIVSPRRDVLAASDPSLVDGKAALGESDALSGRGWSGDVRPPRGRAVAAHAPIYSDDGEVLGIAVAEQAYPSLWERLVGAGPHLGLYLGLGALLGGVGTYGVARLLKRRTRGLASTEIATLADHREALLHAIREGVVAVDTGGRVTMMNDAARTTLGLDEPDQPDPVGRPVDELGLDPHVIALLTGAPEAGDVADAVALVGTRVVVFNRREASTHGRGIGSVTTLRDRTELVSLQSQLSSNLTITDTLRAQTHEFDNQLHTISGLVQLGEYDEVRALVGDLTRHRAEVSAAVSERLRDPAVAAVVIAKHAVAEEHGVELVLDPESRLPALPSELGADLTTILGNLVNNAVDACAGTDGATVEVRIVVDANEIHMRVRDNGPGIPRDRRESVFTRGFSTKPDVVGGRGLGLSLVRLICSQRGGHVRIEEAEAGGAELHVVLPADTSVRQESTP
ncbi:sensor histidine kinase [Prauserella alba]|uniref:sensor histidine kinase n=1 Tax=Prauserella alba TaxID=176898 RepID=UPI0020A3D635|nr:ATP-binding protein [Prauserella alba]